MRNLRLAFALALVVAALAVAARSSAQTQGRATNWSQEPACQTLTPATLGGPMPKDQDVLVFRWLSWTNYELAYHDNVILLDAYYEHPTNFAYNGMWPRTFKRANAIIVGHAHSDHIADAALVAKETGATVIGAKFGTKVLKEQGLPDSQIKTVDGSGELFEFHGFTIQSVLHHHNVIGTTVPDGYTAKAAAALSSISLQPALTDADVARGKAIQARGSSDPGIAAEGTIAYYFKFLNGFKVLYLDSPGPIIDSTRALAAQIAPVDVMPLPYVARDPGIPFMIALAKLFKPGMIFVGHHDGAGNSGYSPTLEPFLQLREALPNTLRMETLYRSPVCINTVTKEVFVGP